MTGESLRNLPGAEIVEHDLDFPSGLFVENGLELPDDLAGIGWLTPWATAYENAEDPPGALDRDGLLLSRDSFGLHAIGLDLGSRRPVAILRKRDRRSVIFSTFPRFIVYR